MTSSSQPLHPNAAWLMELDDRLEAGDMEGYLEAFSDDVVVHVAGHSAIAGTVRGKGRMIEVLERFNERAGDLRFERHVVLADDLHGVLLWRLSARRPDASFEGTETMVVHLGEGRIEEAWIDFEDRYGFDAFIGD